MQQRQLGTNGPMVSAIGLGCLSFGGIFGATDECASLRCLDAAWDHGITFLDTANIYGMGVSESVIGKWLASRKHRPVIATKASIVAGSSQCNNFFNRVCLVMFMSNKTRSMAVCSTAHAVSTQFDLGGISPEGSAQLELKRAFALYLLATRQESKVRAKHKTRWANSNMTTHEGTP